MKRYFLVIATVLVVTFFFGCSGPRVKYHKDDDEKAAYIPFALAGSRITISKSEPTTGSDTPDKKVAALNITKQIKICPSELKDAQITVTPTEADKTRRYIEPQSAFYARTDLMISYFPGTKVPQTVGVTFQDNTVKIVETAGSIAATVGGLLVAATPLTKQVHEGGKEYKCKLEDLITLPIVFDFSEPDKFQEEKVYPQCEQLSGPNKAFAICYTISNRKGRNAKDGKKYTYDQFYGAYENTYTRNIPFSSCADVAVDIKKWADKATPSDPSLSLDFHPDPIIIANPYHVDWLPMPQKGSITSQGICEANSTSEKSDNPDAFGIITAVMKQVDSVWKAWNKKGQ